MKIFKNRINDEYNLQKLNNELEILKEISLNRKYSDEACRKIKIIQKRILDLIDNN